MKTGYAMIEKEGKVTYYSGEIFELNELDELQETRKRMSYPLIFVNPFRTIRERGDGFEAKGDEPILVLKASVIGIRKSSLFWASKNKKCNVVGLEGEITPSVSDEEFAKQVQQIQDEEIAGGNASQVVLSRQFFGKINNMDQATLRDCYKRLLGMKGQYMTFLFSVNKEEYAFVGASPECHLRIQGQKVTMNPIAGTLKKIAFSNPKEALENFLQDPKEINELFQVLDEELKMMAKICPKGGKIVGPELRETSSVIHTEYELIGEKGDNNAIAILRETLHAPTLTGSPIKSASRIINHYEQISRGYYGGQYGVYYPNGDLDCAIYMRTAKLSMNGEFVVQAGAGIVEDSIPLKEAEETTAKANSFLNIFKNTTMDVKNKKSYLASVNPWWLSRMLRERNKYLSEFHLNKQAIRYKKAVELSITKRITIVNNEDDFAFVLAHMIKHMGYLAEVVDTFQFNPDEIICSAVILGPGPGNINDTNNPRMQKLLLITKRLINKGISVLGICLGHQAIAKAMGMKVIKHAEPMQGVQAKVNLFGKQEHLGFYNSFFVKSENLSLGFEASLDEKDRIIAMRSEKIIGLQFHPESIMTQNGFEILKESLKSFSL